MMERCYLVINKLDLVTSGSTSTTEVVSSVWKDQPDFQDTFEISCTTLQGLDPFLDALTDRVVERVSPSTDDSNDNDRGRESALITRARHRQHVEAAVEALERFLVLSQQGTMAVDMAAEELRLATSELGRITGAVDVEDVLDVLFQDFCIGK
jgi:tRNA modification GTPase